MSDLTALIDDEALVNEDLDEGLTTVAEAAIALGGQGAWEMTVVRPIAQGSWGNLTVRITAQVTAYEPRDPRPTPGTAATAPPPKT